MTRLLTIVFVVISVSASLSHDHWINHARLVDPASGEWCCNLIDCAAVPAGGVDEVEGGFLVRETQEVIPLVRVIWKSEDGGWWRCRNMATNNTRCLIGPPRGS